MWTRRSSSSLRLALYLCQLYLSITFNWSLFSATIQKPMEKSYWVFVMGTWVIWVGLEKCVITLVMKTRYLQQPIDSDDEGDISGRKAHCREHYHHGYQSSIWNTRCTNAGDCCRDTTEWTFKKVSFGPPSFMKPLKSIISHQLASIPLT